MNKAIQLIYQLLAGYNEWYNEPIKSYLQQIGWLPSLALYLCYSQIGQIYPLQYQYKAINMTIENTIEKLLTLYDYSYIHQPNLFAKPYSVNILDIKKFNYELTGYSDKFQAPSDKFEASDKF